MAKTIYSEQHKHLIDQLLKARLEMKMDQNEVAKILKKSQSYISKVESGQRRLDIIQLQEFAKIYKKNINFFIK
jgi:transcriptional regulator with XRE-family HTH domain